MIVLEAQELRKSYDGHRDSFTPQSFRVQSGETLAICGKNGSGKSTLVKMICGLISPSGGTLSVNFHQDVLNEKQRRHHMGFVAPYLQLYDEFSAWEHLELDCSLRGSKIDAAYAASLLQHFELFNRQNDSLQTYSSGMKQRFKVILATYHKPQIVVLDEPTTNIDEQGINALYSLLRREQERKIALIIATNDHRDLELCTREIHL